MKSFFKTMYLEWFKIKYFFYGIFIKQDDNAILFIQDFKYTLDVIKNRHTPTIYQKYEINKNESTNSKIRKILKAKYIYIDNYNVLLGYIPKKNKKIVQVWHGGLAIKTIGFLDEKIKKSPQKDMKRYQRVYDSTDLYICASKHIKEVFEKSFLQPKNKLEVMGYPKLDYYMENKFLKEVEDIKIQKEYLLEKLNILYIPTFRENEEDNLKQIDTINKLHNDFSSDYNILYKLHKNVKIKNNKNQEILGYEVLDEQLEKMIAIADIVITDYSSVILEALMQKKSLIYYVYDIDNYKKERGLNVDISKFPGLFVKNYNDLEQIITNKQYKNNEISELSSEFIPPNLINEPHMITSKIIKKVLSM